MARLGVIDLGSNSVRLVVYEARAGTGAPTPQAGSVAGSDASPDAGPTASPDVGPTASPDTDQAANAGCSAAEGLNMANPRLFRILVDEKKMAGLSSYVEEGRLTEAGIERAAEALRGLLQLAVNLKCERVGVFATAVLRNCANSAEAARAIEEAADCVIDVLSAREEAHLGFAGARIGRALDAGTLMDIGGGSAELTALRPDGDHAGISLPAGCVAFYARYVSLVLPSPAECRAMAAAFDGLLGRAGGLDAYRNERAFGIGGSLRAVGKMLAQVEGLPAQPESFTREDVDGLFALLERDPSAFAHAMVKAAPDRAHSLVPGMVIARTLMERLGIHGITLCKYGIREGYLTERML